MSFDRFALKPAFAPEPYGVDAVPRIHHLTYSYVPGKGRPPKTAVGRDSGAFSDLRTPVEQLGYRWDAESFLHYSPDPLPRGSRDRSRAGFPEIGPNDTLVMCTRPPISDYAAGDRNPIDRSYCLREACVFREVKKRFSKVCRSEVRLADRFLDKLEAFRDVNDPPLPKAFSFGQYGDGRVTEMEDRDGNIDTFSNTQRHYYSVGFFLHVGSIPKFDCDLVLAFGMGSAETAAWCRIVGQARQCRHWCDGPRLVVAGLDFPDVPMQPKSIHYADATRLTLLIDQPFDASGEPVQPERKANRSRLRRAA